MCPLKPFQTQYVMYLLFCDFIIVILSMNTFSSPCLDLIMLCDSSYKTLPLPPSHMDEGPVHFNSFNSILVPTICCFCCSCYPDILLTLL